MSRPNFRIIENAPRKEINLEEFEEDFKLKEMTIKELKQKYDIGEAEYRRLKKELAEKGVYRTTPYGRKPKPKRIRHSNWGKNYSYRDGAWNISKIINGKSLFYGRYKTENDAQKVVIELRKCDWDKNQLPKILKELGIEKGVK